MATLVELYEMGFSYREVAELKGLPPGTVLGRLKAYGVEMRPKGGNRKKIDPLVLRQTQFLYVSAGWTIPEIAEYMGVSKSTVQNRLIQYGVPRRSRAESARMRFARRGRKHSATRKATS